MEDELNQRERESLDAAPREIDPDPALRGRIVRQLQEGRLIRARRWTMPAAIAASLLVGFLTGALIPRPSAPVAHTREFMLLVHDTPSMRDDGHEPQRVREYGEWAQGLREKLVDGEKLSDEVSSAGPSGSPSAIGGFFRVRARDRTEADAIARTCPHVKYGGWIEVREISRS